MPDAQGNMTWQDLMSYGGSGGSDTMQYSDTSVADSAAKNAYYQAQARGSDAASALAAAKQAWQQMNDAATLSGYFSSGYGYGTHGGQATFPNLQYTDTTFGQNYTNGLRDVAQGAQTQSALQNSQQYGLNQAGVTGVYYDPGNMTYRPGTFIYDAATGGIGQIQQNGQMQMFGSQGDFLRAGGSWDMANNPDMMRNVDTATYNRLAQAPGQNGNGPGGTSSMALQQMYGTYGMPTAGAPTMALQALYGSNAAPLAGQQTMAQQAQNWSNANTAANQTGWWNAPQASTAQLQGQGTAMNGQTFSSLPQDQQQMYISTRATPQDAAADWARDQNSALQQAGYQAPSQGPGQQTLAAQGQYWKQAFDQAQANQSNTQAYLSQLANLRGPADWAKYQQVLGATPNGMRDLYAASMGQYIPGGGATTGQNPQAANLNTMQQQIGGYTTNPGQPQQPGGSQVWGSGIGIGNQGLPPDQAQQATGNGTNMYGGQQQQYNLPAPNQIAPQSWNAFTPSQQQMFLGMYEANGWNKDDVMALHNQSLPKYGSNSPTAGTWRLQ